MLRELQHIERYKDLIEKTVNYNFNHNYTIRGNHIVKIPDVYKEYFNNLPFMKINNKDRKYEDITELFKFTTDKVYTFTFDNNKRLSSNLKELLPILADKDTYGALIALPKEYNLNEFRSSNAAYLNLTNPLSLIDTESNNNLWRLFSGNRIQVYIFKYDSSKYDREIDMSIKESLYNYLSICCEVFYKSKVKKLYADSDELDNLKEPDLFMQQKNRNGYIEHTIFKYIDNKTPIYNYITYSDIIVNDSVAPHYAIWKMIKKEFQYLEGSYLQYQPMFSPNVNFATGIVCTGNESNNTPEGVNTLIVSNLQSAFTKNLIHKKYTKYWVDINKLLAIKYLEKLLDINILHIGENNANE